jgi:hypothetical protein
MGLPQQRPCLNKRQLKSICTSHAQGELSEIGAAPAKIHQSVVLPVTFFPILLPFCPFPLAGAHIFSDTSDSGASEMSEILQFLRAGSIRPSGEPPCNHPTITPVTITRRGYLLDSRAHPFTLKPRQIETERPVGLASEVAMRVKSWETDSV